MLEEATHTQEHEAASTLTASNSTGRNRHRLDDGDPVGIELEASVDIGLARWIGGRR
jgi:hypothetical protein